MQNYLVVASDLDGTLLNLNGELTPENETAIQQMADYGVYFVPASGRTLCEIPSNILNLPGVRYIIHSDGAVVYDKQTGDRIDMSMSRELAGELLDILLEYDVSMTVRNHGKSYTDEKWWNDEAGRYYRLTQSYQDFIYEYSESVKEFEAFCRSLDSVEMICAFFHDPEEQEACRARLLQLGKFGVAASEPGNIEVFDCRAGKGEALLRLAEHLKLDASQTIGVGDSPNDINMIEKAGLGLAMANAYEVLKEVADEIACHCDEHIAQYVLKKYIVK